MHCPYCHGWEVRDQAIGVLASCARSVHQALLFRQLSADVSYFAHTTQPSDEESMQLAARGIPVVLGEWPRYRPTTTGCWGYGCATAPWCHGRWWRCNPDDRPRRLSRLAGPAAGRPPVRSWSAPSSRSDGPHRSARHVGGGNLADPFAQINADLVTAETQTAVQAYRTSHAEPVLQP